MLMFECLNLINLAEDLVHMFQADTLSLRPENCNLQKKLDLRTFYG
jgi:hypothetical protein